eukprot:scaffold103780_cov15-Tisochrysis_lutea.AAC.1
MGHQLDKGAVKPCQHEFKHMNSFTQKKQRPSEKERKNNGKPRKLWSSANSNSSTQAFKPKRNKGKSQG